MLADLLKANGTTVDPSMESKLQGKFQLFLLIFLFLEIQNLILKNHLQAQKYGMSKKYKITDSDSSITYKHGRVDKGYMDMRDASYEKIRQHTQSY